MTRIPQSGVQSEMNLNFHENSLTTRFERRLNPHISSNIPNVSLYADSARMSKTTNFRPGFVAVHLNMRFHETCTILLNSIGQLYKTHLMPNYKPTTF